MVQFVVFAVYWTHLLEERVHPFCEGLLLDVESLLLKRLDAQLFKLGHIFALTHAGTGQKLILQGRENDR